MAHPVGTQPPTKKEKEAQQKARARERGGGDYGGKGSAEYQKAMGQKDYYWDPDLGQYTTGSGEAERIKAYSGGSPQADPSDIVPSGSSDRADMIDGEVGEVSTEGVPVKAGFPEKLQDVFFPKVAQDAPLVDKIVAYAPLAIGGLVVLLLGGALRGRN